MKPLTEEQQKLVEDNLRLAFKFAKRYRKPNGMTEEDWEAECLFGLVNAARLFNAEKSKFSTYAYASMRYGMFEYLERISSLKRDYRKTQRIGEEQDVGVEDFFLEKKMDLEESREQLFGFVKRLPRPEWREVWLLRLEGKTVDQISAELKITRNKTKQIYTTSLSWLQSMVARNEIKPAI